MSRSPEVEAAMQHAKYSGDHIHTELGDEVERLEARVMELERIEKLRELELETAKLAEDRIGQLEAQNARLRDSNDLLRKEHLEDPRGCHRAEEVRVATSVELSNGSKVSGFAAPNSISIVCDYMGKRTQIAWSNEAAIAVATIILGLHGKLADVAAPS